MVAHNQAPKEQSKIVPFDTLSVPGLADERAEEAVIGALLTYGEILERIIPLLEPKDFYFIRHEYIYQAMLDVYARREDVDYLTVSSRLKETKQLDEIGGMPYLTRLIGLTATSMHAPTYAATVKRCSIRRKILTFADETKAIAVNQEIPLEDGLPTIYSRLQAVMSTLPNRSTRSTAAGIELIESKPPQDLLKTGYIDLDRHIGGLGAGEVCVSAGDAGMGKSYLALNVAWNVAVAGTPVFYASTEMTVPQLIWRLIKINTGITPDKVKVGLNKTDAETLAKFKTYLKTLPIYFDYDDTGMPLTPGKLRNRVMRSIGEHGIEYVVVDHSHDMKLDTDDERKYGGTANTRQSYIVESIVGLAKTTSKRFWTVAQINRGVAERQNKRPTKHDIRDTGRYEQLADEVVLIFRGDVYGELDADPHCTELIIDKVRDHGYTGTVYLYADDNIRLHNGVKRQVSLEDKPDER